MRLSAYLAYSKKTFLGKSAYRFDHLMGILSTCLQFFIFYEIYRALYGDKVMWVRDTEEFEEIIERDGVKLRRFTRID